MTNPLANKVPGIPLSLQPSQTPSALKMGAKKGGKKKIEVKSEKEEGKIKQEVGKNWM